jgi:hypothetical protein
MYSILYNTSKAEIYFDGERFVFSDLEELLRKGSVCFVMLERFQQVVFIMSYIL